MKNNHNLTDRQVKIMKKLKKQQQQLQILSTPKMVDGGPMEPVLNQSSYQLPGS
jgi:hypothetical protein